MAQNTTAVILLMQFMQIMILVQATAFMFGGIDPLVQATLGDINPPQIRSTVYSLNFLATTFGRSISLLLLGYFFTICQYQYTPGYLILSILAFSCNLIIIPIFKHLPVDVEKNHTKGIA